MTIDDRLLKPAGWQYDDYQTAKQAILSDLKSLANEDGVIQVKDVEKYCGVR